MKRWNETSGGSVDDTAYNATSWDGETAVAPSKNAVRDKIEALSLMGSGDVVAAAVSQTWGDGTGPVAWTFSVTGSDPVLTFTDGKMASNVISIMLTDADVAHGITTVAPTTTWFAITQYHATKGGAQVSGFSDTSDQSALELRGFMVADPDATVPAIVLDGYAANGTGKQALDTTDMIVQVRNNEAVRLTVYGNGTVNIPSGATYNINGSAVVNQSVTSSANPSFSTVNLVGANPLTLGTSSTNLGSIAFKNSTNANVFTIQSGVTGATLSWTLPIAAPAGNDYLIKISTVGVMGYTDPATLGGSQASLHVDDILTALGVASEATHFGTFTGSTIADNQTAKAAIQALETKLEEAMTGWFQTTGTFTATPASTSTLTMGTDMTATLIVGTPLKYVIGGTTYYGIVTAIAANLLTVAGAPLGGDVTALYYGLKSKVSQMVVAIPSTYEDANNTALINSDLNSRLIWRKAKAYLVKYTMWSKTHDSGTHGQASVRINDTEVNTTTGGLTIAADATEYLTVVDIATAAYDINHGELIEITAVKGGSGDAANLVATLIFVIP